MLLLILKVYLQRVDQPKHVFLHLTGLQLICKGMWEREHTVNLLFILWNQAADSQHHTSKCSSAHTCTGLSQMNVPNKKAFADDLKLPEYQALYSYI